MLEKLKLQIQENPEQAKKVATAAGALLGLTAVAAILYVNRNSFELPFLIETPEVDILPE